MIKLCSWRIYAELPGSVKSEVSLYLFMTLLFIWVKNAEILWIRNQSRLVIVNHGPTYVGVGRYKKIQIGSLNQPVLCACILWKR